MINTVNKECLYHSFLSLLEYYPSPVWIRNTKGKYLWVNEGFLKFFNVTQDQVINKSNEDFFPPDITNKCYQSEQQVLEKKHPITFYFDEKKYRATVYKTPIFNENNEIEALAALMTDLTPELEIETKLNTTTGFYQSILANMGEALLFINQKGEFEVVNKKGEEFFDKLGFDGPRTFHSWYEFFLKNYDKDEDENTVHPKHVLLYNAKGNIIQFKNKNKAAVIDGLQDYIVVDTDKALLICPRENDQLIKEYIHDLKNVKKGDKFL